MGSKSVVVQPLLLALQQVSVCVDFEVQGGLDVHQLLVRAEVVGHLGLQVLDLVLESADLVLNSI